MSGPQARGSSGAYVVIGETHVARRVCAGLLRPLGLVVERALDPRLVGLVSTRALPRSGHVVVVGLGQAASVVPGAAAAEVAVVGVERHAGAQCGHVEPVSPESWQPPSGATA